MLGGRFLGAWWAATTEEVKIDDANLLKVVPGADVILDTATSL
jgi:hypothetical protein